MTEYTIADVSAGDRVTLEHEDGSRLVREVYLKFSDLRIQVIEETPEEDDPGYMLSWLVGRDVGWRITAVVKPEPVLPTEPGHYRHRADNVIYLHPDGNWFYGMEHVDIETVRGLAPFTRLAPVPETAEKVLTGVVALMNDQKFSAEKAINRVAAEFGVPALTRQGDEK